MPISDHDVNAWFDQNLIRFVENDVGAAIAGRANFGAALMLVCYTEVLGAVKTGTWVSRVTLRRTSMPGCFGWTRLPRQKGADSRLLAS